MQSRQLGLELIRLELKVTARARQPQNGAMIHTGCISIFWWLQKSFETQEFRLEKVDSCEL